MTAEYRTGVGSGILGKVRPHLGKRRPTWAICTKSGQKCSRIGRKGGWGGGREINYIDLSIAANMELVEFLSTYLLRRPSSLPIMHAVS